MWPTSKVNRVGGRRRSVHIIPCNSTRATPPGMERPGHLCERVCKRPAGRLFKRSSVFLLEYSPSRDTVVGQVLQSPHRRQGRYGVNSTDYSGQIPANGVAADTVERPVKLKIYQQRVVLSHPYARSPAAAVNSERTCGLALQKKFHYVVIGQCRARVLAAVLRSRCVASRNFLHGGSFLTQERARVKSG